MVVVVRRQRVKAVGSRGNVTGTDIERRAQGTGMSLRWGAGRGLVYRERMCRRRLWRWGPLGHMEGVRSPGTLER